LLRDADAIVQGVGGVARSSRPYGGRDGRLPHLRGHPRRRPRRASPPPAWSSRASTASPSGGSRSTGQEAARMGMWVGSGAHLGDHV